MRKIWGSKRLIALFISAMLFAQPGVGIIARADEAEFPSEYSEATESLNENLENEESVSDNSVSDISDDIDSASDNSEYDKSVSDNSVSGNSDCDNSQYEDAESNKPISEDGEPEGISGNNAESEISDEETSSESETDQNESESDDKDEDEDETEVNPEDKEKLSEDEDTPDAINEFAEDKDKDNQKVKDDTAKNEDFPVFDYEKTVSGYKISLHADEGVIPEGSDVKVKKVTNVAGQKTEDIVNDILPDESVVFDSVSFDISIWNYGEEIEPENGLVSVNITLADDMADLSEDNDSAEVMVFHIDDEANGTAVDSEVTDGDGDETTPEGSDEVVVTYDAESFSVYEIALVVDFETTDPSFMINPVYEGKITPPTNIPTIGAELDPRTDLKTLMAAPKYSDIQSMAEYLRGQVKNRNSKVKLNFKIQNEYSEKQLLNELLPIMYEHTGVPNEGDYVRWAFCGLYSQSSVSTVDDITYGTISLIFIYTHNSKQEKQTTEAINKLYNELGLNEKSTVDKINTVYNWIITNITYDYYCSINEQHGDYTGYSCYSAIVKKNTVCEGYALLFYRMMLMAGVDSRLIAGYGISDDTPENHGWNIVQIGDKYYNVDSTWDATMYEVYSQCQFYLKGSKDSTDEIFHFNEMHQRWDEYKSADFNRVYPTSETAYVVTSSAPVYTDATSVTISKSTATIGVGKKLKLTASVNPGATPGIRWSSTNKKVAKVDKNGNVTGVKNGVCLIVATASYGGKKVSCRVTVSDGKVKSITVKKTKVTLKVGQKYSIGAKVFPENAKNKKITYKSKNKKVATVSSKGVIKAKKPGTTKIIVKSKDGNYTKTITVKVKKKK